MIRRFAIRTAFALSITIGAAAGISISTVTPAQAQVPTIDLSSLAKLKEVVGTVNKQLGQLNGIFNTVSEINKVIGSFGPGSIGSILGMLGIDPGFDIGALTQCIGQIQNITRGGGGGGGFQGVQSMMGALNGISSGCLGQPSIGLVGIQPSMPDISQFSGLAQGNQHFSSMFQNLSQALNNGQTIGTATASLQSSLYMNGQPDMRRVEAVNSVRSIFARKSAVDAMGTAIQGKTSLTNAPEEIKSLSQAAKDAKDLRGDIAVNNAIMLKILEQLQQNNAQLAALLQMRSASFIANDAQTFSSSNGSAGN
ncbi:hypothetical protein [Microvirga tunisiensis]|uniref:Conjugal transfer protein n=1 Tax=Microvirga tunisiensis TaxID=2108360 RepID=A0A5N7ML17_9HYPH|nr:hypothetical protein [Microvirga tunisiensis]MPR09532.1 hypothetical protein [Microvirga tunisiensis]MPR27752.1 hypothetical protein [Microvirga tunisiensis]